VFPILLLRRRVGRIQKLLRRRRTLGGIIDLALQVRGRVVGLAFGAVGGLLGGSLFVGGVFGVAVVCVSWEGNSSG